MENRRGRCQWCRDETERWQPRYEGRGIVVHAECMEDYLLEEIGVRALALRMGFDYREDETDEEG